MISNERPSRGFSSTPGFAPHHRHVGGENSHVPGEHPSESRAMTVLLWSLVTAITLGTLAGATVLMVHGR